MLFVFILGYGKIIIKNQANFYLKRIIGLKILQSIKFRILSLNQYFKNNSNRKHFSFNKGGFNPTIFPIFMSLLPNQTRTFTERLRKLIAKL